MDSEIFDIVTNSDKITDRQCSIDTRNFDCCVIIGVGGIGSWVALNCALSTCFNKIIMYDNDIVEGTNLNRTPFRIFDIGFNKAACMKDIILERRISQQICAVPKKFDYEDLINNDLYNEKNCVVFDCRDNIFDDVKSFGCHVKVWKLGYDGTELSIDGNPRNTHIWGTQHGYTVTPSFVFPSQLIANLVVYHCLLNNKTYIANEDRKDCDKNRIFNGKITFDTSSILTDLIDMVKIKSFVKKSIQARRANIVNKNTTK